MSFAIVIMTFTFILVVISTIVAVVIMSSYMMMVVILVEIMVMFMVNVVFILFDMFVGSRCFDWHVNMFGRVGHRLVINMGGRVFHGLVINVSLSVSHWLILHFSRVVLMLCLRCIMMRMSIVVLLDNTCAEWFGMNIFVNLRVMWGTMVHKNRMRRVILVVMYVYIHMVYIHIDMMYVHIVVM